MIYIHVLNLPSRCPVVEKMTFTELCMFTIRPTGNWSSVYFLWLQDYPLYYYNYYITGDNLITDIEDKNLTSGTGDMTSQALMEWYISDLKKKPQEKSMKVLCNIINGNNNIFGYMCVNNQKVKMTVMKFHFIIYITWFKSVWYKFWCVKLKSIFLIYDIINMVAPLFSKNITPLTLAGRREAKNCEAVDCVLFCLRGHAFHEIVLTNNIKTQLLTPNVLEVVNCVQYLYQSPCTL